MDEEAHHRQISLANHAIVFRPDHGHELLLVILRGTHPGYPLIGWIRGFSELRGIVHPLEYPQNTLGSTVITTTADLEL